MNKNNFIPQQSVVMDIVQNIEDFVQKEIENKPPIIRETSRLVLNILNEYTIYGTSYHFDTLEEAYKYFKGHNKNL